MAERGCDLIVTRTNPLVFAVQLAAAGVCSSPRLYGVEVVFPDVGGPYVERLGFFRYQNEKPVHPEADTEEL